MSDVERLRNKVNPQPAVRKAVVAEDDDFVVVSEALDVNLKPESYSDSRNIDKQGENVSPSNDSNHAQKRAEVAKDDSEKVGCIKVFWEIIFLGILGGFFGWIIGFSSLPK